ncbi:DUF2835 family protein [Vibrio hepatarius]|uniref:DUF2835 family protein n=1 Tax=Vibrio hepatarius TaxID=171383 RepID=UPI001C0A2837|nr:DUF2835 family protein [Vibrio hepatarius]MBU2895673.1 DUF2835 domain-containing protein [Vibrio hepatarius]
MEKLTTYEFKLTLPYAHLSEVYGQPNADIVVTATSGTKLAVKLARLRPFITQGGVSGIFRITIGKGNRVVRLERI